MQRQRGFTYLGLLLAIALLGIGLTAASEVWSTVARRQRMAQLEWVGQQYAQAIGSYYESTPGIVKAYPTQLEDLLEDRRVLFVRRHVRQLYPNPLTGQIDWQPINSPTGGVRGVRVPVSDVGDERAAAREFVYSR